MHPKEIAISQYDYPLPDERIAKFPLPGRDGSKLLVYRKGKISEHVFRNISSLLPPQSMLVFNNTRVIHARMQFQRKTGALIELFCLEPAGIDHAAAFAAGNSVSWSCLVGNAKRWKDEEVLEKTVQVDKVSVLLRATKGERNDDTFRVTFSWDAPGVSFAAILHEAGTLPIPPYLHRESTVDDEGTYQTVYAVHDGSVAAPTAGLHFTPAVLSEMTAQGMKQLNLTLHVGAGTFKPVKSDTMEAHAMHQEQVFISLEALEALHQQLQQKLPVFSVGTTSLRMLESLYWFGVKLSREPQLTHMHVSQWEPYELQGNMSNEAALQLIIERMRAAGLDILRGETQILIAPGYEMKMVDGLITNFHQPRSTLLLLVSALIGEDWKRVYDYALNNNFRFLSYGDSSLLFNPRRQ